MYGEALVDEFGSWSSSFADNDDGNDDALLVIPSSASHCHTLVASHSHRPSIALHYARLCPLLHTKSSSSLSLSSSLRLLVMSFVSAFDAHAHDRSPYTLKQLRRMPLEDAIKTLRGSGGGGGEKKKKVVDMREAVEVAREECEMLSKMKMEKTEENVSLELASCHCWLAQVLEKLKLQHHPEREDMKFTFGDMELDELDQVDYHFSQCISGMEVVASMVGSAAHINAMCMRAASMWRMTHETNDKKNNHEKMRKSMEMLGKCVEIQSKRRQQIIFNGHKNDASDSTSLCLHSLLLSQAWSKQWWSVQLEHHQHDEELPYFSLCLQSLQQCSSSGSGDDNTLALLTMAHLNVLKFQYFQWNIDKTTTTTTTPQLSMDGVNMFTSYEDAEHHLEQCEISLRSLVGHHHVESSLANVLWHLAVAQFAECKLRKSLRSFLRWLSMPHVLSIVASSSSSSQQLYTQRAVAMVACADAMLTLGVGSEGEAQNMKQKGEEWLTKINHHQKQGTFWNWFTACRGKK